jgi:hypothetical protein
LRRERDGSERQTEDNEQRPAVRTESVETLLSEVICIVAGVSGQHAVDVEIVAAPDSVQMTGGARGFLTERLRANDFLVGYREMLGWLETGLAEYRVAKEIRQAGVLAVVDGLARVPGWRGGISVSRRTAVRGSAQVIRAGLRAGRLGLREVRITRKPTR